MSRRVGYCVRFKRVVITLRVAHGRRSRGTSPPEFGIEGRYANCLPQILSYRHKKDSVLSVLWPSN